MSTAKKQETKILHEVEGGPGDLAPQVDTNSPHGSTLKLVKPKGLEPESMGRILAHDLANHLNVLTLSISRFEGQNDMEKKMLERAKQAMQNMAAEINIARDILVLEEGRMPIKPEIIDLSQLVTDGIREFETSRHYLPSQIEFTPSSEIKSIITDRHQFIEKILYPLLSNAVRFSPENGVIQIAITQINGSLELRIQNQSAELPPDWLPDLFSGSKKFIRQGRDQKKGLGLSLRLIKVSAATLRLEVEVKNQPASIPEAGQFMTQFIIKNFETMD